tara:strand:+ start:319 stop:678 length:360 start_codon:yes stop_codon:yes gene_type:complete
MKLELKHLAPYLTYGLKFIDIPEGYNQQRELNIDSFNWLLTDGKPILRPLKEMYQVEEIMYEFSEYDLELFETSFFILGIGCTNRFSHLNVDQYNMILKNHFDIFGLIEQGLAIDINTL